MAADAAGASGTSDADTLLRRGVTVLKFGRMGRPKTKWLVLKGEGSSAALRWSSSAMDPTYSKRGVLLCDVMEVCDGMKTKVFTRFRKKYEAKEDSSVSLRCRDGLTLDITFASPQHRLEWTSALRSVLAKVSPAFSDEPAVAASRGRGRDRPDADSPGAAAAAAAEAASNVLEAAISRIETTLDVDTQVRGDRLLEVIDLEVERARGSLGLEDPHAVESPAGVRGETVRRGERALGSVAE